MGTVAALHVPIRVLGLVDVSSPAPAYCVTAQLRQSLAWWSEDSLHPVRWLLLNSDASKYGWGGPVFGTFSPEAMARSHKGLVSNVLESRAVHQALLEFLCVIWNS